MRTTGLLAVLLLFSGCAVPINIEGGDSKDSQPYAKPFDEVWRAVTATLEKKGFRLHVQDKASGRIVTEWTVRLYPAWREGRRERLEIEILPVPSRPEPRHKLRVRSTREVNDNEKSPMSEKDASWAYAGGNDEARDHILYLVQLRLKGAGFDD
ncbi:MAG: hypothetical protein HYY17_03840 [Planctomycetes bacterium]|nr:hypothetical protein [Planctomycetota bacterium]